MEFDWTKYLNETGSIAVPEELFSHVEASFNNGIKQGMLLEVCYNNDKNVYWTAEITLACGPYLRCKFIGAQREFWCDISSTKVHPIGWCREHDELVEAPDEVKEKYDDIILEIKEKAAKRDHDSVTIEALNNKGLSPIDRIEGGMKVEVQNILDPCQYWIATVRDNRGGRLLLAYDGADEDLAPFFMFYRDPRLRSFGFFTNKGFPSQLKYPGRVNKFSCKSKLSAQLRKSTEESIRKPTPADLFQYNPPSEAHSFAVGMKVEALSPVDMNTFCPATVTKIFNNLYFLVVIDDHIDDYEETKMAWMCDNMHPYIYPIGWAHRNKLELRPPKVWKDGPFNWEEYLSMTSSVPAPDYCFGNKVVLKGFEVNMKLEATNPLSHDEIHVANIVSIVEHMLYVELLPIGQKYWYSQDSDMLFPVGWYDSNNYERAVCDTKPNELPEPVQEPKTIREDLKTSEKWCGRIYFNNKCYAGPSVHRKKLALLPKHVGPGAVPLVMTDVLNKIISASYKPTKLLKDWEMKGSPEKGMKLELLRAKFPSKSKTRLSLNALVPIVTKTEQVESFCRDVCVKLQACPALFGPIEYPDQCPHNCQQVKKSTFHRAERRGKPKGGGKGQRNKENVPELRKMEQPLQETEKREGESVESEHSAGSVPISEAGIRSTSSDSCEKRAPRRKRVPRSNYPKMEMKTRGAKLPNFAIQMKESHWIKKDVKTMYGNSYATKRTHLGSNTENETNSSSCNSKDANNISVVSDGEEPDLKKLKFDTDDPLPSDNIVFDTEMAWVKEKLSRNPAEWSIDDVHEYLSNTEDCKFIADKMKQEKVDGEAFIMLDLDVITHFLHMKKEFALQLCKHVSLVRWYYDNFNESGET